MSHVLISRSRDLKQLRTDGYNISVHAGHLVMRDVPYVTTTREVKRGTLVSVLQLNSDRTDVPSQHVVHFIGEYPCDKDGTELARIKHGGRHVLTEGLIADHSFSSKPAGGYKDYYEKMTTYANILSGPAQALDPAITARTFRVLPDDDDSVFHYFDTASTRVGIGATSNKLAIPKVAIVGLGGTGSYILDLVSKTHVTQIHLFDGDVFLQHNAFRSPGAASNEDLDRRLKKVDYYAQLYGRMRRNIIAHPHYVDAGNVADLGEMAFVFVCLDKNEPKQPIIEFLEERNIPFIDVGMGVNLIDGALQGSLRITASTAACRDHVRQRVSLMDAEGNNEYHENIQIADLNALNAALAVVRWKKFYGFYHDLDGEHHCTYEIDGNHLLNEDASWRKKSA